MIQSTPSNRSPWRTEIDDIVRGAAGGFLSGPPLIYTMEVWWIGSAARPPSMLLSLGVTFVVVFALNRTDGFRQGNPDRPLKAAVDSVEALAIGIVCTLITLILLREITHETSLHEILGKVIFESIPFAIGVALARSILSGGQGEVAEQREASRSAGQGCSSPVPNALLGDVGATLVGATIIAFNIAPTDEIPMLSAATSPPWLLGVIAASLIISYGIVFVAGFTSQHKRRQQQGLFQNPLDETVLSYLISLLAAAFMLWFFQRLSFDDPWILWLQQVLLLGLPATVGGAAGRLAI